MWLRRLFTFEVPKKTPLVQTLQQVHEALGAKADAPRIGVYLANSSNARRSVVEGIVKKLPELTALGSAQPLWADNPTLDTALTNLGPGWEQHRPHAADMSLSWDAAFAIADGIPRPWTPHRALFVIGPIAELSLAPEPLPIVLRHALFPTRDMGPELIINNCWGSSRRTTELLAAVIQEPPEAAALSLPVLPAPTTAFLDALADKRSETQRLVVGPDAQGQGRRVKIKKPNFNGLALRTVSTEPGETVGPPKAALVKALKPLGYRYRSKHSGGGTYVLTKSTSRHNVLQLQVEADAGSLWRRTPGSVTHEVRARLMLFGPTWDETLNLPVSGMKQFVRVRSRSAWLDAVANIAAAVQAVEQAFVAAVEERRGGGLAWCDPSRNPNST